MSGPIARITSIYLEKNDSMLDEIRLSLSTIDTQVDNLMDDLYYLESGLDKAKDEEKRLLTEIHSLRERYSELHDFLASFDN
jgi:predicted nuclease with TOPRIM domain